MKKILVLVCCCFSLTLLAQRSVNEFQYVIVPSKFGFTNDVDQYRLNTLTKLLLEKYGFKTYFDTDSIPNQIAQANCENLYANVEKSGNFVWTKLQVLLKDCQGKTLYQSAIGTSKEKEYRVAYTQSLRQAFESFESLHYQYQPKNNVIKTEITQTKVIQSENLPTAVPETLYAQVISNGYQLVDASPKVVMKIYKTSDPSTFTAVKGTVQGVLISKNSQWFFEHYENDQLVSEKLNIKF
ncbi:hypothetical protein G4D82_04785 [Flavobacterium sp. CYK-4]|uniref:hypothetical protein n=1 Tax=Flavobacterium lotistagni TaxID=2709660 RepID=UPI00140E27B0|nr:hypothetical protein [Flavobacterium lotistagni]NHM06528.1 hypothetical protein [Flavobacterium lotistagni]